MAERRIVEKTGKGIVCFISNYSWLDGLSFTGMRERYLEVFDKIWIDCLNGDKYKTGKLTPDGKPDPSVFSTEHNREGIQVGTAIALLARKRSTSRPTKSSFAQFWGVEQAARSWQRWRHVRDQPSYREFDAAASTIGLPFRPWPCGRRSYCSWPLLRGTASGLVCQA